MRGTLVRVSPLDTVSGNRVEIHLSSMQDRRVTGLDGKVWDPCLIAEPQIGIQFWNGDFTAAIEPGRIALSIVMASLKRSYANVERFYWPGAPIKIWTGAAGDAWPWTEKFNGTIGDFGGEDDAHLTLNGEVDNTPFDVDVLTATYAGTGGAEGTAGIKGKVKPLVLGWARVVEPVPVDPTNNVYQFSGYGAIEAVSALYERGTNLGAPLADYASYAALVGAAIAPGKWATCLAQGMVRLGAPAAGLITGDVRGHRIGAATPRLTGAVVSALATLAGVDPAKIETATLTALDAAAPFPVNVVIDTQASFLNWMKRLVLCCNWQAGISLLGKAFVTDPAGAGAVTLEINADGSTAPQVLAAQEETVSPPYKTTILGAERCWRVHGADEIAYGAPQVDRGAYLGTETYREGNIVSLPDGSRWIYINAAPGAGNAPPTWPTTSNTWWSNLTPPLVVTITGFLTNPSHTVATAADGSGGVYSDAGGTFYVTLSATGAAPTSGLVFSVVSPSVGLSISINPTTGVYSGISLTNAVNQGTATLRATYNGQSIDQVYSIAKSKAGAGSKILSIYSTRNQIAFDAAGAASPSSQTNVFLAEKQNTTAVVTWSVTDWSGNPRTPVTNFLSAATGDSVSQTAAQFTNAANGTPGVMVTATLTDGATYTDKLSVIRQTAGASGSDGAPAIGYVQDTTPPAGSFINQTWYQPTVRYWWRWNGSAWVRILGDLSAFDAAGTAQIDPAAILTRTQISYAGSTTLTSIDGFYPIMQNASATVTDRIDVKVEAEWFITKTNPTAMDLFEWEWKITRTDTANAFISPVDVIGPFRETYRFTGATIAGTWAFDQRHLSSERSLGAQPSGLKYFHFAARCITPNCSLTFASERSIAALNNKRI